jgi:hypothetical protein
MFAGGVRAEKRLLRQGFRRVLAANGGDGAHLSHAPKRMRGDIWTTWLVAQVFRQQLFAPVRSHESGFDRYLRNGSPPIEYLMRRGAYRASDLLYPVAPKFAEYAPHFLRVKRGSRLLTRRPSAPNMPS